ncbi:glycosyl hydrolase family 8 [Novosphingobium sp. PP1Y]|uniref:glycosyl hydrolase family 8 n=1 Tax=Novosphingobium sp. PP1Y TaxID=702113 RepID=UPI00020EE5FF|nr:glycosyl hydrolase family 8 [Novosphingobium sp. PP1Y]CCA89912.1 endoglucanase [Novosphingobium sp. PP1Y]
MAVDRRTFSTGLLVAMTAACTVGSQGKATVPASSWLLYRKRFVAPEGRVVDTGNGNISHSEGQGYGMLLAAKARDADMFAKMARWTEANLGHKDMALHSWRYDPSSADPVSDPNNATDGDVLIAWALAIAAQNWSVKAYAARSQAVRAAIRQHCVASRYGRSALMPGLAGFETGTALTINPSYFIWPAFDDFARMDGQGVWDDVISDSVALTTLSRFGPDALPTDWVDLTGHGEVAPASGKPPRFGFDAVRVPLYAMMGNRPALAAPVAAYWRKCLAQAKPIPAWIDVVTGEEAPYAISTGGAAVAGRLLGTTMPTQLASDYFAASLQLLATG